MDTTRTRLRRFERRGVTIVQYGSRSERATGVSLCYAGEWAYYGAKTAVSSVRSNHE